MEKLHGNSKSVLQLDKKTGVVLAVYSSEKEAAKSLEVDYRNISKAVTGVHATSSGFKWTFNTGTSEA